MPQNYQYHRKYYYPQHFIFYPIVLLLLLLGIKQATGQTGYLFILSILVLIGWLAFMMRQHYGIIAQNRIIRLELRLRYYQLTQNRLETVEEKLSFSQLAALRFAPDEELPDLINRSIEQNLTPNDIKKSIKNWLPDHMRV